MAGQFWFEVTKGGVACRVYVRSCPPHRAPARNGNAAKNEDEKYCTLYDRLQHEVHSFREDLRRFREFWRFSDMFGSIQIHSDLPEHARMH